MTSTYMPSGQSSRVELATLHALMVHFARQYEDAQEARVSMDLRVGAMRKAGLAEPWLVLAMGSGASLGEAENAAWRQMKRLARRHPMIRWLRDQKGFGLPSFTRLLGVTGDLYNFQTIPKLWRYLGLHVVDGSAARRRKGQSSNWSHRGRALCFLIGQGIVMQGAGGLWRATYDRKKADYEANRPDWTPLRRHNAAMRYAVKKLLAAMWREWRVRVPLPAVIEAAGHQARP